LPVRSDLLGVRQARYPGAGLAAGHRSGRVAPASLPPVPSRRGRSAADPSPPVVTMEKRAILAAVPAAAAGNLHPDVFLPGGAPATEAARANDADRAHPCPGISAGRGPGRGAESRAPGQCPTGSPSPAAPDDGEGPALSGGGQ